jgi:hypothetical protein
LSPTIIINNFNFNCQLFQIRYFNSLYFSYDELSLSNKKRDLVSGDAGLKRNNGIAKNGVGEHLVKGTGIGRL